MIYNKEPILVLWDIVKDLGITTYKEFMIEDENDIPESYILLRSDINNNGKIYGDGLTKARLSDCDIMLISKGAQSNTTDLHNINKKIIETRLINFGEPYRYVNVGYSSESNTTTSTWTLSINVV